MTISSKDELYLLELVDLTDKVTPAMLHKTIARELTVSALEVEAVAQVPTTPTSPAQASTIDIYHVRQLNTVALAKHRAVTIAITLHKDEAFHSLV